MTQLLIPVFYRQFGVRRIQAFLNPKPQTVTTMPRGSMIHFASFDKEHLDVDTSKLYFGPSAKKVAIDFQEELLSTEGNPRHSTAVIRNEFRDFLRENRKFRYLKNAHTQINDDQTLFVINYSYLDKLYRYADMPLNTYYHWYNTARTMFAKIDAVCKESHKNHFIFCDVPSEIPSLSLLGVYSDLNNVSMLKVFDTTSKLFILNLHRWLATRTVGDNKVTPQVDNIFSAISETNLPQVNIVFNTVDGRSVVVNLGYLNSWIKDQPNTTEFASIEQISNVQMQKALLKFLLEMRSFIREEIDVPEPVATGDAADTSEDAEIIQAQKEYDIEHDADLDDDIEREEYSDALSYANRITSDTKIVANIAPVKLDNKSIDDALIETKSLDDVLTSIDEDLAVLENVTTRSLQVKGIQVNKDGNLQKHIAAPDDLPLHEVQKKIFQPEDTETILRQQLEAQVDYGLLTASDYRGFIRDIDNFKTSKDPYGSGAPYKQAMVVTPESLLLNDEKTRIVSSNLVQDKSMLQSSLLSFDQDYISKVLHKDMMSMVFGLQNAGIAIRRHDVEVEHSALGSYESHTLEFKPVDGQVSTVRFKVPVVQDDGTFTANGNKYVMRKQRVDAPIRKIKPTEVALTSYYGKTFVKLNPKKSNSSLEWIIKELNIAGMSGQGFIKRVNPAKVFDNNFKAPFIYNGLADNFKSIVTERFTLVFDHSERKNLVNDILLKSLEQDGKRVVGQTLRKEPLVVDKNNMFFVANQNAELTELGDIFDILQLDASKAPVDFSEVNIFSKSVPVAFFLGYNIGFKNLLKLTQAKYRVVEGRQNKNMAPHEYAIQFKDYSYIFSRKDKVASMILAGFNEFDKQLKQYEVDDFNTKDIYLNLLESKGLSAIYIREMDLMQQLFIDPITRDILKQMNEPQTFNGLLMRATELLQTYHHPDSQDMKSMRIRGYERIPGAVYKEMAIAIRAYRNRNIAGRSKVDISPYKVWTNIMEDPSKKMVEDINPIQNLKETEVVTYSGEGGRGKDSMNRSSRAYHVNDMGIVSEATVDSSDVGVNAYLSANPRFKDLRGLPSTDKTPITPSSLISTSALLAPGSDSDDVKRVNFVSIQQGHTIAADGYHQPVVRTGYEYVIANRTTEMFAYTAKQNGKVLSITPTGIIVEYDDKTTKGVTLGRVYGKAEGSVYPHDVITDLVEGQKFEKGTPIAYNTGFFEKDFLDPRNIVMKNSRLTKVALLESSQTHEDSCAISPKMSLAMKAKTTKVKSFVIDFKQNLINVVKPGQQVNPKTLLMIIEDEITSSTGAFDEESLKVLKRLSNQAPKASYLGVVDKIEVFYHGDKSDMSGGLKALAERSDRQLVETSKSSGRPVINGQVNADYRVSGTPLTIDKAEVRFYITIETVSGTGDKVVAANQMKSVIGEVMDYKMTTEDGTEIEMVFGCRSIMARIVTSPFVIGTTATLLSVIGKKATQLYRS